MDGQQFDRDLVRQAQRGDLDAYGRLVGEMEALVRAAIGREVHDPGLADDAVQETFLRAFRKLSDLRDPAAFPGWIRRVAITTARNELRRRRLTLFDPGSLPEAREHRTDENRMRTALSHALIRLPPAERRLLERYYRGRWSTARLATEDGLSEAAVRKRLQRARDRLREDITMSRETGESGDLPARIVDLLSRPVLVDLPENPVGAVWEEIRATRPDDEEIDLPEMVRLADIEAVFSPSALSSLDPALHRVDAETVLRFDLTVPMLIAAGGRRAGTRLICAGKVYRDEPSDRRHVQSFHQAELMWIGPDLSAWDLMGWFAGALDIVLPGRPIRVVQVEYPLYAGSERGYEVQVRDGDGWLEIAGFSRFDDALVSRLGMGSAGSNAVSLGMGLERIACLRYGIDDVRQVEARRIDD